MTGANVRAAFEASADGFLAMARRIPSNTWDAPGLGEWTVRDLVGHASRGMQTVVTYAEEPAQSRDVQSPVDYFLKVLSAGSPASVAERGRQAGAALGPEPIAALLSLRESVHRVLQRLPDDALLSTPAGGMRLADYLPTRTLELTIHTMDVAQAIGMEAHAAPDAVAATFAVLAGIAERTGRAADILRAITGRAPLPQPFTLL